METNLTQPERYESPVCQLDLLSVDSEREQQESCLRKFIRIIVTVVRPPFRDSLLLE